MNFFEQQEKAQRNSGRLLLLMLLAVVSLIAITSLALGAIWQFSGGSQSTLESGRASWLPSWELVGLVALVIIAVVLVGSLYKWVELRKGGTVVAERLGGRLINLAPQSLEERRLLNVVEEMALASGTPVPPVYVLDDASINAFAAGLSPQDAVIGVTRGAISQLSREELQGVIAHEFSHIFHGDMRLNTRLVAVLNGILLLGLIGGFLLRNASRGRRTGKDNSAVLILVTGLTLWVLGYAGTFFGNLIKAAVSRQREYLADASAVQFTRNPDSIAGALKKIGGNQQGSQLASGHAAEFSHMYFAAGIAQAMQGLMATHPPLDQRIRRITPGWDGIYPTLAAVAAYGPEDAALAGFAPVTVSGFSAEAALAAISAIGKPDSAHLAQARDSLVQLDAGLHAAAHSCIGAQAIVYGLLLDKRPDQLDAQLRALTARESAELVGLLEQIREPLAKLAAGMRLPLLDLAMPALRQLGKDQYVSFKANLVVLIRTDERVALHEWALLRIVERNVNNQRPMSSRYQLQELSEEVSVVLSLLARAGAAREQEAEQAFARARTALGVEAVSLKPVGATGLEAVEAALGRLSLLKPLQKPRLLKALARCIEHDGRIEMLEAELLRAVADILDCPMPPLLPVMN